MNIFEKDHTYIADTYARFPINIVKGSGALLYDENGKEYIDLGTGIGVNIFGMCDKDWMEAVTHQMQLFQHTSNLYYAAPCATLAQTLCERTQLKKVFFSNSGAEANECAIKAARKYAKDTKEIDDPIIITLYGSFHGRTITTLAATGQDSFHTMFCPLTPGFAYANPNDIEDVKRLVNKYDRRVAAVMIECVQGEGGVNALEKDYVQALAELCHAQDILLITDEVQCGNGRTGTLYAYMQYNVLPDIVTTAKGLGGGLPLGATLLGKKVEHVFTHGTHGSTFGGNPICCAGAQSILDRLDETFLSEVRKRAQQIRTRLAPCPGIRSISGMGLMVGLETVRDAGEVIADCIQRGVLPIKAKNKVRLLPPLNITEKQLSHALDVLYDVCCMEK